MHSPNQLIPILLTRSACQSCNQHVRVGISAGLGSIHAQGADKSQVGFGIPAMEVLPSALALAIAKGCPSGFKAATTMACIPWAFAAEITSPVRAHCQLSLSSRRRVSDAPYRLSTASWQSERTYSATAAAEGEQVRALRMAQDDMRSDLHKIMQQQKEIIEAVEQIEPPESPEIVSTRWGYICFMFCFGVFFFAR